MEYYNLQKEKVREIFEEFKATVFCHEYDHLNGILHIDLAENIQKMTLDETRQHREEHPYEVILKNDEYNYSLKKL